MADSLIRVERRDAVAVITLDRPEKLNAWTPAMAVEQARAIEEANADPRVGAIVMTGAGRGFCAGADMIASEPATTSPSSSSTGTCPKGLRRAKAGARVAPAGRSTMASSQASPFSRTTTRTRRG